MKRSSPAPTNGMKSSRRTICPYVRSNIRIAASQMNGSESTSTPSMSKMTPRSGSGVDIVPRSLQRRDALTPRAHLRHRRREVEREDHPLAVFDQRLDELLLLAPAGAGEPSDDQPGAAVV